MQLCRYQPINKFSLQNLLAQKCWASKPQFFNDPFEFSIRSNYTFNSENKVEYLTSSEDQYRADLIKHISDFGIVSFSTDEDNILLWSHYSDNHKGFCLKFELPDEIPNNLYKVEYQNTIAHFAFAKKADFKQTLIIKGLNWAYEKEWR